MSHFRLKYDRSTRCCRCLCSTLTESCLSPDRLRWCCRSSSYAARRLAAQAHSASAHSGSRNRSASVPLYHARALLPPALKVTTGSTALTRPERPVAHFGARSRPIQRQISTRNQFQTLQPRSGLYYYKSSSSVLPPDSSPPWAWGRTARW